MIFTSNTLCHMMLIIEIFLGISIISYPKWLKEAMTCHCQLFQRFQSVHLQILNINIAIMNVGGRTFVNTQSN